jgi:ribose-phosphate pyrophosphokinase
MLKKKVEVPMSKHYFDPRLKIFALNSNRPLAEKIAEEVGVELGKSSVTQFSDGEIQVNIEESIRGCHVYVVQSTSSPVNDNLMELLIMIDALKRASAKTINVVMPYYGYARQDRKARAREPITAKLVANMIEKAGATRLLTLDLHASQIQGFFDIPVDHLMGAPLIADYFLEKGIYGDDVVVVSPDHGGVTRARKLAEFLKAPIAIIDKRRPKANVAEVMNIIGKVDGKTCVIIDDMIDTAGTITLAANALKEAGAKQVYASCTHPVLSGPAMQRIQDSAIEHLVVTDSIYLSEERKIDKIDEISVGVLMGDAIKRIHENKPVSPLFETHKK